MNNKLSKYLALTVVAGSVALAGCGSSSDSGPSAKDAQKDYAQVNTSLNTLGTDLGTEVGTASGKSEAQLIAEFSALSDRAEKQVAAVKALKVPDDIKDERDALATQVAAGAADLQDIVAAGKTQDTASVKTAFTKLVADSDRIDTAKKNLKAALDKDANKN